MKKFNEYPCIICGGGNSIPFDNEKGLDSKLKEVIESNVSFGINYFNYFGCSTTALTFVDGSASSNFYKKNLQWIENIPLIIGRYSSILIPDLFSNTILIPKARYYFGKNGLRCNKKVCLKCKTEYDFEDSKLQCQNCKTQLWRYGLHPTHLSSMFTLSLAIALGFEKIFLLGNDAKEIDGKTHFYQSLLSEEEIKRKYYGVGMKEYKDGKRVYRTSTYTNSNNLNNELSRFGAFKNWKNEGLKIYNVSPESTITIFPRITYEEFYSLIGDNNIDQEFIRSEIKQYILDSQR